MLNLRRFKPLVLAALAAPMLASSPAAHAAWLALTTHGNDVHFCSVSLTQRDGREVPSRTPRQWVSHMPVLFDLGELPAGVNGDSPEFGALTVRCWVAARDWQGNEPHAGQASYSLTLGRHDGSWDTLDPRDNRVAREYPRDGRHVSLILKRSGHDLRPIKITRASLGYGLGSPLPPEDYGPWMHRYFIPD